MTAYTYLSRKQIEHEEIDPASEARRSELMNHRRHLHGATIEGGEKGKPGIIRDGLFWLFRKQRISERQYQAGKSYGDDYRASDPGRIPSALGQLDRVDGGNSGSGGLSAERASRRLSEARDKALNGQSKLIIVANRVCGQGEALVDLARKDDRLERELLGTLKAVLDLLADHYRL